MLFNLRGTGRLHVNTKNSSLYYLIKFVIYYLTLKNNLRLDFMAMIGVRVDDEFDKIVTEMATKKGISKSDFVRNLLIRGFDIENNGSEILSETYELMHKESLLSERHFKLTAKILALVLRVLSNINSNEKDKTKEEIQLANKEAMDILIRAGVME